METLSPLSPNITPFPIQPDCERKKHCGTQIIFGIGTVRTRNSNRKMSELGTPTVLQRRRKIFGLGAGDSFARLVPGRGSCRTWKNLPRHGLMS